ncbi:hypothetical protein HZS_3842 [Henneguya salminicola]|nr:hypothetical protein HZS_3842 [Henneguya salminicola]
MPQITTCDFELSLISAIKHEFPSISDHNCRIILSNIELLTVFPIEEITTVLRYISTLTLWNISNINDNNIAGRSKNALERHTRRIGENFANANPNLASFISIIRTEFLYYSERCAEIRQNFSGIVYQSEQFSMPEIDPCYCYLSWKRDQI